MRDLSFVFLLGLSLFCPAQRKEHRLNLPRGAEISIGPNGSDTPDRSSSDCPTSAPTEEQIRWRFRKFVFLDDYSGAKRQEYDRHRPCWTNGTVTVNGQSYVYQVRWPDILFTNFPDGKDKLLQGGPEGDNPPANSIHLRPRLVHFILPAEAEIFLGKSTTATPNEDCSYFQFSAQAIRRRFQTYHALADGEFHDSFGVYPCRFDGTVVVHGHTYTFEARQGNLLVTDFPDGEGKMLGGAPSNPLNDAKRVRLDPDVSVNPRRKGK